MDDTKQIRQIFASEIEAALALAWRIFSDEIAQNCPSDGVDEFWCILEPEYNIHRTGDGALRFWGAFEGDKLVGMCAVRELEHIHLLFVDEDYRYQGMGTSILKKALIDCKALDASISRVTVQAIGDSQGFFETLGFTASGERENDAGVPYIPMEISSN